MLDEMVLERRLVTLEQTVSDLQKQVSNKPMGENWLEKLTGSISDEAAFLEALEYGRDFRQSEGLFFCHLILGRSRFLMSCDRKKFE
jgi:hypothetical protein